LPHPGLAGTDGGMRWCDSCQERIQAPTDSVVATRTSWFRRGSALYTGTITRSYRFHSDCWDRVSGFGGYQWVGTVDQG
jgi:hypothetical protein